MITPEQSEQVRKKMEVTSSRINDALDSHSSHSRSVGIKYESNPDDRCPRCGSGLKRKVGKPNGVQRWECILCNFHYMEKEMRENE